jgi:hypothetical protein
MSQRAINKIGLPNTISCHNRSWQTQDISDSLTICNSPPEVMPQLINAVLLCFLGVAFDDGYDCGPAMDPAVTWSSPPRREEIAKH